MCVSMLGPAIPGVICSPRPHGHLQPGQVNPCVSTVMSRFTTGSRIYGFTSSAMTGTVLSIVRHGTRERHAAVSALVFL